MMQESSCRDPASPPMDDVQGAHRIVDTGHKWGSVVLMIRQE